MSRVFIGKDLGANTIIHKSIVEIVIKEKNSKVLNVIVDILVDVQLKYDLNISPVIYSEHEYSMNVKMDSPFTHNIAREGITL
ncbi:MAG: hypothetical protein L3J41_15325 [Melioribacteraceae bacterium]|nr:hypothetical protein [Melioribacteraceae bacterium]